MCITTKTYIIPLGGCIPYSGTKLPNIHFHLSTLGPTIFSGPLNFIKLPAEHQPANMRRNV